MYGILKKLRQRVLAGACECSGASAVEYAVVLCLITLVCISTLQALSMWSPATFARLTDGIKV